ncbi:hypothetical protein D3C77_431630 [compost metagenome]
MGANGFRANNFPLTIKDRAINGHWPSAIVDELNHLSASDSCRRHSIGQTNPPGSAQLAIAVFEHYKVAILIHFIVFERRNPVLNQPPCKAVNGLGLFRFNCCFRAGARFGLCRIRFRPFRASTNRRFVGHSVTSGPLSVLWR